jgi:predicted nuclease of predicted toxin-antitoxin system
MSDPRPAIKFYTDTHIAKAVAVQLRNRGIDVIRCEEVGMAEAEDSDHLEYAAREGRVMITNDEDFLALAATCGEQGKSHAGIMHCHAQGEIAIGIIVREFMDYFELVAGGAATLQADIINRVIRIG